MTLKTYLHFAVLAIPVILIISMLAVWRSERQARATLEQQLSAAQQTLRALTVQQSTRDAAAKTQIATLERQKRTTKTPADILRRLPDVLPLPKPLTIENPAAPQSTNSASSSPAPAVSSRPTTPQIRVPSEDLKPLYDNAIACKECQLELAAVTADLKDERAKSSILGKERDQALHVAKGGSVLHRVARAAKWLIVGAAVGAAASRLAH